MCESTVAIEGKRSHSLRMVMRFLVAVRSAICVAVGLLAAAGCSSPQSGGQTGGEGIGCVPVTVTPLELDEASPLGFSGAEALETIGGEWTRPLTWGKGGETELTLSIAYAGETRYLDREWKGDGAEAEPADDCPDVLELAISVEFTTADGGFAESWTASALAPEPSSAWHRHELDLDALEGSYEVSEIDPTEWDDVVGYVDLSLTAGVGASGSVDGLASRADEDQGPDGVAEAVPFTIAMF